VPKEINCRHLPNEISMISSNLPSGYHRDMQLIKESFIPSFDMLLEMLSITGFNP
jgi:argininosuccinate lyase